MNTSQPSQINLDHINQHYQRDGFCFPLDILSESEATALRADLESAEASLAGDPDKLKLLHTFTHRLLPSFDALVKNPKIVSAVSTLLGDDLLVWGASIFVKEPESKKIVSWHQDLTYWGLDDSRETTCWVALSPATVQSGCMKFVAGSHTSQILPHNDTFHEDNLLSRGQEIAVEVDEKDATPVVLNTGQASLHHGHLFHASGPNTTLDRRIGVAIRYITSDMKQTSGERPTVVQVSGNAQLEHFQLASAPTARLTDEDFALCHADQEVRNRILY